ncbi:MAG TPA: hypothetical protein VGQ76_15955 [Thermoanaerobaculia bacterium]|nr:hypothetical protein [Thermoanaerobaculia bacterium]
MSDWKEELAPVPGCIEIARFSEELNEAERAHLETCVRCQTELALFREIDREETSAEETEATEWIAGELRRRNNVVAFRPKRMRVLYAVAAALVMVIGIGSFMQMREPSIDVAINDTANYRSARFDVIAPIGDIAQAPNELRWNVVPSATRYHVEVVEVDMTHVWSGDTTQSHIALRADVIAQFAPGKSLLWDVKAFRGNDVLASSETQTVRVSVPSVRKDP